MESTNSDYPIKINELLRNLLVFMNQASKTDPELSELLTEVFEKYFVYYRTSFFSEILQKFLLCANHGKIPGKSSEEILVSRKSSVFEEILCFGEESCFADFCYYLFLFGFEEEKGERLRILSESLNEKVYCQVQRAIGEGLDELIVQMDILKKREE
jgi:hypothetical protein